MGKYYVTTPIYYVNDVPHIGTAYPTVAADVTARFHRMMDDEVLFSTGTDENATKVARVAEQHGEDPKAFVDKMASAFIATWKKLNISYDDFIRTTQPRQTDAVQKLISTLYERGDVYYAEYEGWYCIPCETHFLETQLVDGKCPDCGRAVEWMKEPGYFFRLSKYTQPLLDYIEAHPDWLQPEFRKNEVVAFLKGGLKDVNITRQSDWGIPVPEHMPNSKGLVIYVWYDALINYITVAGYPENMASFEKWWPVNAHIVGKDIFTRFHATLWPAMLMGAGLPLPETVVAHGFWTIGGEKISKSKHSGKGFRINPLDLAQEVVDASGADINVAVDALRYFLLREMPFGADGDFSLEALFRRYNSDLANDFGNLVNRTVTMIGKYCAGMIPETTVETLPEAERATQLVQGYLSGRVVNYLEALKAIWDLLGFLNRLIEEKAPWKLFKTGQQDEVNRVMYTLAEGLRLAAVMAYPFMPTVAEKVAQQIGWTNPVWANTSLAWGTLKAGSATQPAGPIFPRIVEKTEMVEEKKAVPQPEKAPEPVKVAEKEAPKAEKSELVSIDDFAKIQFKVGTIIAAEKHPKADKLLKLRVDLGETEPRQVIAGIAAVYPPETLVGRQIVVVANLQPAKLRGEISQGMLLAADLGENGMALLKPDKQVENGSKVR
ncbi:MAG TPA: methionine--tRNA ligase [Armatimonadota bacterium]|nr:methionine--tRNA ligase [Armatimonadota bacterium]